MRLRTLVFVPLLAAAVSTAGRRAARADDPPPLSDDERGYIGFIPSPVVLLRDEQRKELGVTATTGAVVSYVEKDGPADKAGLKPGDLLVKYKGQDVPDTKGVDPHDRDSQDKWVQEFGKVSRTTKPGDEVEIVVDRKGTKTTIQAKAITKAAYDALRQANEEENSAVKVPPPKDAGDPVASTENFEKVPDDLTRPADFLPTMGVWEVFAEEGTKPENHVLRQYTSTAQWAVCYAIGKGHAYADGTASVRLMPIEGTDDASGGIIFRGQDWKNFYVVRANALEDNLRIYVVKNGERKQLGTAQVDKPALKKWHTLSVTFAGTKFKATLDDKASVEATDDTFAMGWCGLWTKADSITQFDDWKTAPAAK